MANRLKMTVAQSILSLHAQRWSQHRIADTLEIDRGTVARHIRRAALAAQPDPAGISNAANAPIDPARVAAADSKAAIAPTGSATAAQPVSTVPAAIGVGSAGRQSDAEPWRESILAGHAQGLSAKRIHQDLVAELGASGISYDSVRRLLKRLGAVRPLPMRRMECEPGQEAQVDFGSGARIKTPEGKRRKTHVLRVVLSHSRKAYSEACFRQTAEDFLRVLENAFWHFGGVPKTVVVDNLKAAVLRPDWFDPDLNPKLQSFAQHYGTVILPTKPRMPRHKGKVERGVGYVQDNGLKGASSRRWRPRINIWRIGNRTSPIRGFTAPPSGMWARCFAKSSRRRSYRCPPSGSPSSTRPSGSSAATVTSKSPKPITPRRRSIWAARSGRVGTNGWCGSSIIVSSRSPCMFAGAGQVQHLKRTHRTGEDQRRRAWGGVAASQDRGSRRARPCLGSGDAEKPRN